MSNFQLHNEGVSTPRAETAFTRYNKYLGVNSDRLVGAISRLALNVPVEEELVDAAEAVTEVLDSTNNGTQIGIGPRTEDGWARVFEDDGHKEARTAFGQTKHSVFERQMRVAELQHELAQAQKTEDVDKITVLENELLEEKEALANLEVQLEQQSRMRGYHVLRIIAELNIPAAD